MEPVRAKRMSEPRTQVQRRISSGRHGNADLAAALGEWQASVVCLDTVDPLTTELVRLRCANHHDCHT